MRKFITAMSAAALVAVVPTTPALADGAVIDKDLGECQGAVPGPDGELSVIFVTSTDLIIRANKTWTTMTCHFDLEVEETPTKGTRASNFDCNVDGQLTSDTRASASAGGRMVLTCRTRN